MKRSIYCTVALIVVLGGCGSFNNSFNTYLPAPKNDPDGTLASASALGADDDASNPAIPVPQSTQQKVAAEVASPECSVSPYPAPGKPPEIPLKELQAAAGDVYAIERIERKHINELRAYIMERRQLYRDAHLAFIEKCSTANKR